MIKSNKFLEQRIKIHSCHETYRTEFFKRFRIKNFSVYKGVFRPEFSPTTLLICKYLIENKKVYAGKKICDLGCGSGIFSMIMVMNGASKVIAVDIFDKAVQNTKENVRFYNLKNINVKKSNLFQNIRKEKFDIIISNFPVFFESTIRDYNFFVTKKTFNLFFNECKNHLKRNGKIILPTLSFNNIKTIDYKKKALKNGFNFKIIYEQNVSINNQIGKVILYEFFNFTHSPPALSCFLSA